jgi:hypothetical protein
MPGMPALPWDLALFCPLMAPIVSVDSLLNEGTVQTGRRLLAPVACIRVVEGKRLESDSGDLHQVVPKHLFTQSIQRLPAAQGLLM